MLNSKAHNSLRTGKKSHSDDASFFSKIGFEILSFITVMQFYCNINEKRVPKRQTCRNVLTKLKPKWNCP